MTSAISSRARFALGLLAATAAVAVGFAVFSLSTAYASPNTLFSDGFESAGNLTGWTADAQWQEAGTIVNSGTRAAKVQGNTGATPDSLKIATSTLGYSSIVFSYSYRIMAALEAVDYVRAQWSPDNGTTWYTVATSTNEGAGSWQNASFTLPAGANNKAGFQIRFQAKFNGPLDAVRIDDVSITGEPIVASVTTGNYIYNSIPTPQPESSPSEAFQATQTNEFGDYVQFAGTDRTLVGADVMLNSWACQTGSWDAHTCANPDPSSTGYTHPITLTIYSVDTSGPTPVVGAPITSVTQNIFVPWRPASDSSCSNGQYLPCANNGYNFVAHFTLPNVNVPDKVIYGISFNTQTYGAAPIGVDGPYNALNFSVPAVTPSVGTDLDSDAVFWNTETAGWYTDGGAAGVGIFRQDTGWTGNVPAARFSAITEYGSIKIVKYSCPIGTTVTRAANGVGGTVPAGCNPQAGATFGYVHGSQTDANSPYPELSTPLTAGGSTSGTGVLHIANLPATGRYLVVETNGSNQQLASSDVLGLYCVGDGDQTNTNDNQELTFVPANAVVKCVAYDPAPADATPPSVPTLLTPANGSTLNTNEFDFTWTASTDDQPGAITYQFHSSLDGTQAGGVLTNGLWTSPDPLPTPMIHSSGAPDGTWYWQVRAQDAAGNWSGWSEIWNVILNTIAPPPPPSCTPNEADASTVSDTTVQVDGHGAVVVTAHPAWVASIPGATWIYSDANNDQNSSPTGDKVFTKTFTIAGTPTDSTLDIAADNMYTVSVNGHVLDTGTSASDLDNFTTADTWTIPAADLVTGSNTITITVTNPANNPNTEAHEAFGDPNPAGLLFKVTVQSETCPAPAPTSFKVHIMKYIDNGDTIEQVPNEFEGPIFPMIAIYDIVGYPTNLETGDGYNLGDYGNPSNTNDESLKYAADTIPLASGDKYGTHEVTGGESPVVASAEQCSTGKYYLEGYKVGTTLEAAQGALISTESPFFDNITSNEYVIVVNKLCSTSTPEPTTVGVHIFKYVNGQQATAENANNAAFPMKTTFTSSTLGNYTDTPFTLSPTGWGGSDSAYEASYVGGAAGDDYSAWEVTTGNDVVGASCEAGKPFALDGYSTGTSIEQAVTNGSGDTSPSSTVPSFTNLQGIKYVIVWNKTCPDTTPTPTFSYSTTTVRATDLANNIGDVIATPTKWFFYDDEDATEGINNTLGSFVTGPSTAPLGNGSAQMTDIASHGRTDIATYAFSSTSLASITSLQFSAYSHSGVAGLTESPYLVFNVSFNGADTWQKRLVYVPSVNGAVPQDTWNTFDAISGGAALWTWSGYANNGNKWPDNNTSEYRTWNALKIAFPEISIRKTDSFVGVRVGEPGPTDYTGNVDKFVIGIKTGNNTDTKIFDFEPTQAAPEQQNVGGGNGGGGGSSNNDTNGAPATGASGVVAGASTDVPNDLPAGCSLYLNTYLKFGSNNKDQIIKLQTFLNSIMGAGLPVSGVFGPLTFEAVKSFQLKYWDQILAPWVPFGLPSDHTPTGFVYKTTQRMINILMCNNTITIPQPQLP